MFSTRRLSLIAVLAYLAAGAVELALEARGSGDWLLSFSVERVLGLAGYVALAGAVGLALAAELVRPGSITQRLQSLPNWRATLPSTTRWLLTGVLVLAPTVILLGPWGRPLTAPAMRILLVLGAVAGAAAVAPADQASWFRRLLLAALAAASLFAVAKRLVLVTDYPFKLGWSEGNRLWDYSLYFRWEQYGFGPETAYPSYLTPGRHALWGLPFLIPDLGIAAARLWDALLWIVPYAVLAWGLVRRFGAEWPKAIRWTGIGWAFLFLTAGGIFAPLTLSAIVVIWGYRSGRTMRNMLLVALAGCYAGLSRWTWLLAPGAWGVMLVLLSPRRIEPEGKRWQQAVAVGLAGVLGGLSSQWISNLAFPRPDPVFSTALSQPLLWYRLFPGPTNSIGVLAALLLLIGPPLGLLAWAIRRRRVHWTRLEQRLVVVTLLVLTGAGLAASVKIGGGSNLHNADMLLVTVLLLAAMAAGWAFDRGGVPWSGLPELGRALLLLSVFVPALDAVRTGGPLNLPAEPVVNQALSRVQAAVQAASEKGPVLFIDQRQLFTFGQVEALPMLMDYELKDVMNQALGSNEPFFEQFRKDLAAGRFSLIVSDPLPSGLQGRERQFGEENDAWFNYVATPLREYYRADPVLDEVGVWLLRPKAAR